MRFAEKGVEMATLKDSSQSQGSADEWDSLKNDNIKAITHPSVGE